MSKTPTQIRSDASSILQDPSNAIFTTAELDLLISKGVPEISKYRPYETKVTLQTTIGSKDLTLTSDIKNGLLWIEDLEFRTDKNPRQYRNFTRFGDIISMEINFLPEAVENVYLFLAKIHTLTEGTSTLDTVLEDLLADLVAARAAINNSRKYISGIDISGADTPQLMLGWGQAKLNETLAALRRMATPRKYTLYARS